MQRGLHEAWEIKLLPRGCVGNGPATSMIGVAGGLPIIVAMDIWGLRIECVGISRYFCGIESARPALSPAIAKYLSSSL